MFALYSVSTLSGGIAHATYTTLSGINSPSFKLTWFITVCGVTTAGGAMGVISNAVGDGKCKINDFNWSVWIVALGVITWVGGIRKERPAADIFCAGVSQFIPTVYLLLRCWYYHGFTTSLQGNNNRTTVVNGRFVVLSVGLVMNSLLLPAYAPFVERGWTLGDINMVMHFYLGATWSMQWVGLDWICDRVDEEGVGKDS